MVGASLLSVMLILGQPFMALADTKDLGILNFGDIKGIITEQNINVQINQNDRLASEIGKAKIKKTIKDLQDDIDDINEQRKDPSLSSQQRVLLGAEKSAKLDAIKDLERKLEDLPIAVDSTDINATINDNTQIRTAEQIFISYNQLKLRSENMSMLIDNIKDQLETMELQEKLGMIPSNDIDDVETKLVDAQNQLESVNFQQDSSERQLKILLNRQDDTLQIGSVPVFDEQFTITDKEADLKKAMDNSYSIKLKEDQIVTLTSNLERAKKDNGASSNQYKLANYELDNANMELTQLKDNLKSNYYTMLDNITKLQSDLSLAEQSLEDKKVALFEAQIRLGLGMITQLEMDKAITECKTQENSVKTQQIELFKAKCNYDWFLQGMPQA